MALYEYTCKDCGKLSEILVFSDDDTPLCNHCGSDQLEKQFSSFAVSVSSGNSSAPAPNCPMSGSCGGSCDMN